MAKPLSPKEEYEKLVKEGYFSSSAPSAPPPPATGGPTFEQTVTRGAEMSDLYTDVDDERRRQRELEALRVRLNDPAITFDEYTKAQKRIDDLEKGFGPAFAVDYAGATPSFQGEEKLLGIPGPTAALGAGIASPLPLNVPAPPMSTREIVSDILKPQIVVGPAAQQYAVPKTTTDRAREVFPEALFQESTADKTPEERAEIRDQIEAQRAAFAALADALGPEFTNEQVLEELRADIEEIPKAMRGEGRLGVITQEPEAAGIERIYARQTTPGQVPKLSTAQRAYIQGYYESAYPRFSKDIEKRLRDQVAAQEIGDVPEAELSEADVASGGAGAAAKLTKRKRTPAEIETEVARRLPEEIAAAQAPWWATDKREEILANPEKYAVKTPILSEGRGRTIYPTGATREGIGARALRVALAPFNVVVTGASTGAARLGEDVARLQALDDDAPGSTSIPSTVDVARAKRTAGTKAASLPEGFFGDISEAVLMNRGGKQTVEDLYKELGYNEYVGAGLGLALDILVPPMGGVVSGAARGSRAASAAYAARAAGLIEGVSPVKAFGQGFGSAFRDAWTWRGVGSVLPGSLKIQAAEDTGRMFALRNDLLEATAVAERALDEDEVMKIVRDFAARNEGGGSLVRRFEEAAQRGTAVDLAADVQKSTNQIGRGSTFMGAQKLVKLNDEISDGLKSAGFGFASGSQRISNVSAKVLSTIIRNAAARSETILDALAVMKPSVVDNPVLALTKLYQVDPQAVNRAIGATIAFDAFNQAQKAKGFAEFGDLVLVSNRYIATPDKALEAMKRAAASPTGKFIKSILEGKTDVQVAVPTSKMLETNPNRVVQVISVTRDEAKRIKMIADAYERGGIITKGEADYARALLGKKQVSIEGLRYLANGNMDLSLAGRAGFDINNIKTVTTFRPTTYAINVPIYGPLAVTPRMPFSALTEQAIAKQRIFTPPEMRSVFDGIGTRAASIFTDSKVAGQLLDVPPTTIRAVEDFYAQVGTIDKRISSLYDNLRAENPKLRAAYGLPQTGKLSDDDVLRAVARGPGGREAGAFVDQVIKQSLVGYKDAAAFDSVWSMRTFFTNAADGSFTAKGAAELAASKVAAVNAMKGGTVPLKQVVQDLRDSLVRITSDPANTTPTYKLSKKLDITADQVPDVIGGAIYLRDVDILKGSISQKLINDDAYATVQNLLPPNIRNIAGRLASLHVDAAFEAATGSAPVLTGAVDIGAQGQKTLFQGAVVARQRGYIGADGIMQGMVEHMLQRELGYVDPAIALDMMSALRADGRLIGEVLNQSAPVYFQAAEQAIRRAGLSGDSVQDVIDATFALNKSGNLPVTTVSGIQVQDAIDTFLDAQTFQPVLNEIAKNLPKNAPAFQKIVKGLYDLLELVGNVRYNLFLYTRPAYHTTNAVTAPAIIHATLGIENAPGAADFGFAVRAMQRGPVGKVVGASGDQIAFVDGIGRPFTYGDLRRLGTDSGLFKTEQQVLFSPGTYEKVIEDAAQMGLNPGVVRKVGRVILSTPADVANSTDNFWRMSSFIGALRRGAPLEVAQEIGKKSLFDYGSLNAAERAVASRLFIFYTFSRLQAENVVKLLGSTNGAARFVRQAAVTRDLQSLLYEYTGGKDYDMRRFYMKDRDLSRLLADGEKVGLSEYTDFSPAIPAIDSFMQISALLYARDPIELTFGTQTGGGQFLDPLLKSGIDRAMERPASEDQKRADRLRLMAPEHVAALTNAEAMPNASFLFGEMTPLFPSRETSKTYNGKEWQLTPEGYARYKLMRTTFQIGGIESSLNYWAPIGDVIVPGSEQNILRPGKSVGLQASGILSSQERPTLSAQEEAVLKAQRDELQKREKFRAEQQEMMELQQLQGGGQ